jgi:dsDNA-specific endonuclease/ATPase MutS2
MYNWCLVPPDQEKIKDQNYQNDELNKIVGEYRRNQMYAKEHFEERKREMIEQAAEEAKRAALKKMEETEATGSTERVVKDSDEIIEGTLEKSTGSIVETDSTATPSELMDSMVNGACVKR